MQKVCRVCQIEKFIAKRRATCTSCRHEKKKREQKNLDQFKHDNKTSTGI